jgi:hypothetical protein
MVKLANLKVCVETRVACNNFTSGCDTDISIGLDDVVALYNKYQTQFIGLWNAALNSVHVTINEVIQVVTSTEITYTVKINWDSTLTNIDQVVLNIKKEFAATLGVTESQVTASATASTNKRASMATDDVKVVVTGQSSGANSLTFFMAPVIILNALLWLFK